MRLPRLSCGVNLLAEGAEAGAEETFKNQMIKTTRSKKADRERADGETILAAPNVRIGAWWIRLSAPRCRRRPRLRVICASCPIVRHFLHELDKVFRFRQAKGFLPHPGSLVADDDDRAMVVSGLDVLPDLVQSQVDILFLAGEKIPSGFGMKPLRILFEPRRRICGRIHTDRDEKDVFADALLESRLYLFHGTVHERAYAGARGKERVDDHHLALQQIAVESHLLAVLVEQHDIGEIFPSRRVLLRWSVMIVGLRRILRLNCPQPVNREHRQPG